MVAIANLAVQLSANTEAFANGMTRAVDSLAKFETSQDRTVRIANSNADKLVKKLEVQAATYGMSAAETQAYKLAQNGASMATINSALAIDKQIKAMEAQTAAMSRGAAVTQSMRTPMEAFSAKQKELDDLLARGAITQQTHSRALAATNPTLATRNALMERGAAVTASVAKPLELHGTRIKELDSLVKSGAISHTTYQRAVKNSHAELSTADRITAKFGTTLGGTINIAKSAGSSIADFALGIASMGAVAAGVAAAGLAALTTAAMHNIDATAKTADKLGMSTESLTRLRYAADLAGVGNEQFDKSLQKMVLNIGHTVQGTGEAASAFSQLGLNAQALSSMSPDEALKTVADSMGNVTSSTDRVRLAYQIFGKEGVSMLNVLSAGRAGLDASGAEADKLGVSFSRIDAAKVEAANDNLTRVKSVLTGIGTTLAIQVSPFIDAMATKFVTAAASGEGMGVKTIAAFEWVATGIANVADWLELLRGGFYGVQAAVTASIAGSLRAWAYLGLGIEKVLNLLPGVKVQFGTALSMMVDNLDEAAGDAWTKAGQSMDNFSKGANSKAVAQTFAEIKASAQTSAR